MRGDERPGRFVEVPLLRIDATRTTSAFDRVVTEEPLEIRLQAGSSKVSLATTMRTPGHDFELAAGFALSESIVHDRHEIDTIAYCVDDDLDEAQRYNVVTIALRTTQLPDVSRLERHFTMHSACGVCGKANIDALETAGVQRSTDTTRFSAATIAWIPDAMRRDQPIFERTGGLHAAALFAPSGEIVAVREDVGRHNAVDKLFGMALLQSRIPAHGLGLFVSGRTSFEIVQKAATAGVALVAGVSAPSSLAVELAQRFSLTLLGFVRGERANVYAGRERVIV